MSFVLQRANQYPQRVPQYWSMRVLWQFCKCFPTLVSYTDICVNHWILYRAVFIAGDVFWMTDNSVKTQRGRLWLIFSKLPKTNTSPVNMKYYIIVLHCPRNVWLVGLIQWNAYAKRLVRLVRHIAWMRQMINSCKILPGSLVGTRTQSRDWRIILKLIQRKDDLRVSTEFIWHSSAADFCEHSNERRETEMLRSHVWQSP
jgi:hypothetical protein